MYIVCFDLEGIFTPEIWISIAEATDIDELKLTTRDEPDYDKLMKRRIKLLKENGINIKQIQNIIRQMQLLPGAKKFMRWIRTVAQVAIITDNFKEFLRPLMKKLGYPLTFCHHLEIENDMIIDYHLRIKDMKRRAIQTFKNMNFNIIAVGDSYNDIEMLREAEYGVFFRPPENVIKEFPEFPFVNEYSDLKKLLSNHMGILER
ncbi:MAG: bifunctional phosphoserine phosphatase/homoserine phosphotransferase ThrH [Promethearchaeota archaeon]|nr:MAG: bifunctional phosphoserine phosphatase/homoserine phosphotransferase ThrH [Candidatus Lokiarchaeota archaeon]